MPRKAMEKSTASAGKKRSVARRFNDALAAHQPTKQTVDRRTERKLERFRAELKKGAKGQGVTLTPLDVAMRIDALLRHGDSATTLRRLITPKEIDYDRETMVALLKEMHPVYGYRPTAYRFAGVDNETLLAAGVIDRIPKKRGPKKTAPKSMSAR